MTTPPTTGDGPEGARGPSAVWRELELGAIRAHILHHAAQAPFYGMWMVQELARHGYTLSYGTLYPTLHRLEEEGLLRREERVEGGRVRKYYSATAAGRAALARARHLVEELYREVVAGEPSEHDAPPPGDAAELDG
jgi:DNA-binding PadR family transcriptional regulator